MWPHCIIGQTANLKVCLLQQYNTNTWNMWPHHIIGQTRNLKDGRREETAYVPVLRDRVHSAGLCLRCPQWSRSVSGMMPAAPGSGRIDSSPGFSWTCPPLLHFPHSSQWGRHAPFPPVPTCFTGAWNTQERCRGEPQVPSVMLQLKNTSRNHAMGN